MKTFALAGAVAALSMAFAGAASAAVVVNFDPGPANAPSPGYNVIDNFDTAANIGGTVGTDFVIMTGSNSQGAQPGNDLGGGNYLSVLGNGGASIQFSALTSKTVGTFEFDWGSIDAYNSLAIHYTDSTGAHKTIIVPGTASFPNLANGNQVAPGTNGLFVVTGTAGETFNGIVLTSSQNSFEIDNLAIGVPEPATWAMMLLGLGAVGGVMRTRRRKATLSLA